MTGGTEPTKYTIHVVQLILCNIQYKVHCAEYRVQCRVCIIVRMIPEHSESADKPYWYDVEGQDNIDSC